MKTNIIVIEFPSMKTIMKEFATAIGNVFEENEDNWGDKCSSRYSDEVEDFTPKKFKVKDEFGKTPKGAWGVGGTPANEDLRFGYELAVDEPRCQDYDCRWEFEDDHAAYDKFVSAGEDCVERGLARPQDVVAHRCNAIRKPIGCPPPMKDEIPSGELIGETQWWCEDLDWNY